MIAIDEYYSEGWKDRVYGKKWKAGRRPDMDTDQYKSYRLGWADGGCTLPNRFLQQEIANDKKTIKTS